MLKREFKMKNGRYNMNKQSTKKLVIYGVLLKFTLQLMVQQIDYLQCFQKIVIFLFLIILW